MLHLVPLGLGDGFDGGLGLSGCGLSTDGLVHHGLDIGTDGLGDTGGHVLGHILEDGGTGSAVLGHNLVGNGERGGMVELSVSISLGFSLSLADQVGAVSTDNSRDDGLDILADGFLLSDDLLAEHNGLSGALGLGVALLSHHNSLRDNLADRQGHKGGVDGVAQAVAEAKTVAVAVEGVGISLSSRCGEGGGGQEGDTKSEMNHDACDGSQ